MREGQIIMSAKRDSNYDGGIELRGLGPYSLPCAQSAGARVTGDAVTITVDVLIGDPRDRQSISVAMVPKVALALATGIESALKQIETSKQEKAAYPD